MPYNRTCPTCGPYVSQHPTQRCPACNPRPKPKRGYYDNDSRLCPITGFAPAKHLQFVTPLSINPVIVPKRKK